MRSSQAMKLGIKRMYELEFEKQRAGGNCLILEWKARYQNQIPDWVGYPILRHAKGVSQWKRRLNM